MMVDNPKQKERGSVSWRRSRHQGEEQWFWNSLRHRDNGPAWVTKDYKKWYHRGLLHREDGPAIIYQTKKDLLKEAWYIKGRLHREDGPAIIWQNGNKSWYLNGELHRLDGPAIIKSNGNLEYWVDGKQLKNDDILIKLIFSRWLRELDQE